MSATTTTAVDLDAHARALAFDLEQKLAAERLRWLVDGAPRACVRPAGEAFGWRWGSGPCDCPPCLARPTEYHAEDGATV